MGVERLVPTILLPIYRQFRSRLKNRLMGGSNENVFSEVYRKKLWGEPTEAGQLFYSGDGSYDPSAQQYGDLVLRVIEEYGAETVLEIGCGDFSIASHYATRCKRYIGVDVVPDLVEHHRERFGSDTVSFLHADAARQKMPDADLCIIRQVLQHLSNRDIARVLGNTRSSRRLLVTEHLPAPDQLRGYNIDKAACPDIRVTFGSGVFLEQKPFSRELEVLSDIPIRDLNTARGERLRTVLLTNGPVI